MACALRASIAGMAAVRKVFGLVLHPPLLPLRIWLLWSLQGSSSIGLRCSFAHFCLPFLSLLVCGDARLLLLRLRPF